MPRWLFRWLLTWPLRLLLSPTPSAAVGDFGAVSAAPVRAGLRGLREGGLNFKLLYQLPPTSVVRMPATANDVGEG